MGLIDIPGWLLIGLGAAPIAASALVEKYYTPYYTAWWNLYGIVIVALGFLQDAETYEQIVLAVGLGIAMAAIFFYILKTERKNLIPKIGASGNILAILVLSVGLFYFQRYAFYIAIVAFSIFASYWIRRSYFSNKKYLYGRRTSR